MKYTAKQIISAALSGLLVLGSPATNVLAQDSADTQAVFTDAEEVQSTDTIINDNSFTQEEDFFTEEDFADTPSIGETAEDTSAIEEFDIVSSEAEPGTDQVEEFTQTDNYEEEFTAEEFTEVSTEEMGDDAKELLTSSSGDFTYELESTGLTITGYTGTSSTVDIPSTLDGYKVTAISRRAFANNYTIRTVTIPETIITIGAEAFFGCSALSTINFNAKNCTVPGIWNYDSSQGAGVFSGAGSASGSGLTVKFGSNVTKVPDNLFNTASTDSYGTKGYAYAYVTAVTFASSVSEIGENAFFNCKELASVKLGSGISKIDASAFRGCAGMTKLTVDDALAEIGESAFRECTSLKTITWGTGLGSIGPYAFSGCTALTSVSLPNPLKTVGRQAFYNCSALTSLTLPKSLTSLGAEAFRNCIKLNSITINSEKLSVPGIWIYDDSQGAGVFSGAGSASGSGLMVKFGSNVTKVPDNLFNTASTDSYGTKGYAYAYVTAVTFASSVSEIGENAFFNCKELASVKLGSGISKIDASAFRGCAGMTKLTLDDALAEIGESAFRECTSLKTITWGTGLGSIGPYAFSGCTALTSVSLPNPLKTVGRQAFYNCSALTSLTLPKSLTSLGAEAFRNCIKLNSITINSENLSVPSVWIYDDSKGAGVFSGAGSASGSGLTVKFGSNVTKVPDNLFNTASTDSYGTKGYAYAYVTAVTFASSVSEIGENAFFNCKELASVKLGSGISKIGESAFRGCAGMTKLTVDDALAEIGESAFRECTSLKTITWGTGLGNIGPYAFSGCTALTSVSLPNPLKTVGRQAFYNCSALTSLTLPKSLTSLGAEAFRNCIKLNSITINSENLSVPSVWIYDDSKGAGVFSGAGSASGSGLTVKFGSNVTKVPDNLFNTASTDSYGAKGYAYAYITEVEIPSSVTSIGERAFYYCQNLASVTIRSANAEMGSDVFTGCTSSSFKIKAYYGSTAVSYAKEQSLKYTYLAPVKPVLSAISRTTTGIKVTWKKSTGSQGYYVYRKADGESSWSQLAKVSGSTTSYTDKTVKSGTKYTYTVKGYVGSVTGSYDKTGLSLTYLTSPTLGSIANGSTGITVKWGKVSGADGYTVYRKISGASSWTELATISKNSTVSYTDKTVKSGTTYVYTVSAYKGSIKSAKNSTGLSIKYLSVPSLGSISNGTSGITVKWNTVTGAGGYYVYRKAAGESSWTELAKVSGKSTASYTDKTAESGTEYTYTVRAYSGTVKSTCSQTGLTITRLTSPVLGDIGNTMSGITVKWSKVTGAGGYYVYRKTSGSSSWTELAQVSSGSTGYTDKTAKSGTTYIYTVRAYKGNVKSSYDLTGKTLKCLAVPVLGSITNGGTGVTVKWSEVAGAGGYYVYRKTSGSSSWKQLTMIEGSADIYTDTNVTSGITYVYTIRAYSDSVKSAYDQTGLTFTYLSRPTVSSVENVTSGITVRWSKVSGASGYYLYRSGTKIKTITSASTLTYTDTAVKSNNGTKYQYKIVAYKSVSDTTAVSAGSAVKTIYRVTAPALSSVKNTASKKMTAAWSKNAKATGYQIQYSTSSSFASVKTATITSASTVSKVIGSLTKGKKYYVRIRAYKTVSGTKYYSAWSGAKSVTISK